MTKLNPEEFPEGGATLYRMQSGSPDGSLGIHWTRNEDIASSSGLGGTGDDRFVHRATVQKDQIIPRSTWMADKIRRQVKDPGDGKVRENPSQWGLDIEQEVRLRPGTQVSDHSVTHAGSMDYRNSGRQPVIEHGGSGNFINLEAHAVPGTQQARDLGQFQGSLPHVQMSMLEAIEERPPAGSPRSASGRTLGYVAGMDVTGEGDWEDNLDRNYDEGRHVAESQGVADGAWRNMGDESLEQPLRNLRN